MRLFLIIFSGLIIFNASSASCQSIDNDVCLSHFDLLSIVGKSENDAFSTQKFTSIVSNSNLIKCHHTDGFNFDGISLPFACEKLPIGTEDTLTVYSLSGEIIAFDYLARKSCVDDVYEACSDIFNKKRVGRNGFQWNDKIRLYFFPIGNGQKIVKGFDYSIVGPLLLESMANKKTADSLIMSGMAKLASKSWDGAINDFNTSKSVYSVYEDRCDSLIEQGSAAAVDFYENSAELNISRKLFFVAREDYIAAAKYSTNKSYYNLLADKMQLAGIKHRVDPMLSDAEGFASKGDMVNAIRLLREALSIDVANQRIKKLITDYETAQSYMLTRSIKVFKYADILPSNYTLFKEDIESSVLSYVKSADFGIFKSTLIFNFDTLGLISQKVDVLNASFNTTKIVEDWRSDIMNGRILKPSKIDTFFMASTDTLNMDVLWSVKRFELSFKVKKKNSFRNESGRIGIDAPLFKTQLSAPVGYLTCSEMMRSKLYDFLEREQLSSRCPLINGRFEYEIKQLNFNDDVSYEVNATGFRNASGPGNVFYSIIMPGWGTRKVYPDRKKRATLRFVGFITFAGMAVASKLESDRYYDLYLDSQYNAGQIRMENLYSKSDLYNKIFVSCAGMAATIYVIDVIDVFAGGLKNKKFAWYLNQKMESSPLLLLENGRFK